MKGNERVDSEVSSIHHKLHGKQLPLCCNKSYEAANEMSTESLQSPEEVVEQIKLCSRLEELLLWKKVLKNRASPIPHNQKELALERQKDKLEGELKKVITALTSPQLAGMSYDDDDDYCLDFCSWPTSEYQRDERYQFDEASNQILQHFKLKEDELSKAIASYRAEAEICDTFVQFLETRCAFHSSYSEHKDKLVNEELERHQEYFANLAISLLSAYKEELGPSIASIRELVENFKLVEKLNRFDAPASKQEKTDVADPRRQLEEHYQTIETKFLTAFSVLENIKQQLPTKDNEISRSQVGRRSW